MTRPRHRPAQAAVPAAAAAPAVVEYVPPPPPPPYVQAALDRKKVPIWMAGAGVATLLWAFLYAGVLFSPGVSITDPIVAEGEEIYAANCASCHGAAGQGTTGRRLAGQVLLTFPNADDHIAWVTNGSPAAGTPYGDPDRPGGQHISQDGFGPMPPFGTNGTLTEDQIRAVVRYEREVLDNEEPAATAEAGSNEPSADAETEGAETGQPSSSDAEGEESEGAGEDSNPPAEVDE